MTEATGVMDEDELDEMDDDLVDDLVSKYKVRTGSTSMPQVGAHTEDSDTWEKVTKNIETRTSITISISIWSVSTDFFKPDTG